MSDVIEKLKLALEYENEGSPGRDVISPSEIWEAAEQLFDRIQSLEAQLKGHVLVPVEPTEAMIDAGITAHAVGPTNMPGLVSNIYIEMVKEFSDVE